jgi:hypothetical protein
MSAPAANWRQRLRGDPASWLLDYSDNPSVYFWFQRDVIGRPEDANALRQARELILYSTPVQQLFAAQDDAGFWDNPHSLDQPRYRATLWSLALLAELGAPRASRRARAACEFILQNHLGAGDDLGLDDQAMAGLLLRTLNYFGYYADPRVARAIDALAASVPSLAPGAAMYAVWALIEIPDDHRSPAALAAIAQCEESLLDALARDAFPTLGAFPPFDATDALLALRVLAQRGRVHDARAQRAIEKIWARQEVGARWSLEKSLKGKLVAQLDDAGTLSKWATLNALRVLTKS